MFLKEADLNQIIIYQTLKLFFALFPYISLGHFLASDIQFQSIVECTEVRFASFLSGGLNIIISQSSKSIEVIKLSFYQNDP